MDDLIAVIQKLYASEINAGLQANWDAGIDVWLGDDYSGKKAKETFAVDELPLAAKWLDETARQHFPDSDYARNRTA